MAKGKIEKIKNPKGAGRKEAQDPKDKFVLFIERSKFCGKGNEKMSVESKEYEKLYEEFKAKLYSLANANTV